MAARSPWTGRQASSLASRRHLLGFSLIEALVAFVILSLTLAVIMRIFSQGLNRLGDSDFQARAVVLAESKLALLGADIPLEAGEVDGVTRDALHWRLRLSPYDPDREQDSGEMGTMRAVMPVQLLRVEIEVRLDEAGPAARSIRFSTVKLAPRAVR